MRLVPSSLHLCLVREAHDILVYYRSFLLSQLAPVLLGSNPSRSQIPSAYRSSSKEPYFEALTMEVTQKTFAYTLERQTHKPLCESVLPHPPSHYGDLPPVLAFSNFICCQPLFVSHSAIFRCHSPLVVPFPPSLLHLTFWLRRSDALRSQTPGQFQADVSGTEGAPTPSLPLSLDDCWISLLPQVGCASLAGSWTPDLTCWTVSHPRMSSSIQ
ncbi:hypothetical protein NMY22_g10305 [Coprinellus aureogranulatus]|nr:hypothetical protein NMY22_g10305 [Coprinellus aureogranulatus]